MNMVSSKIQAALPDSPALARAFERLARGTRADLLANLVELEGHCELEGTQARTHCYALALDGMGWPRSDLLVESICDFVVDYAIPRSKINEAVKACEEAGHQGALVRLAKEARSLFTHLKQSGEGGELLLYCLAETLLGFPQIMAKMHLKTAPELHYNGADGVHASVDPASGQLCLWWGESKMHKTATGAIRECMASLVPFLVEPQSATAKRSRDLQLLRYGIDLDDKLLEQAIKAYLDTSNRLHGKLKFGGIGLVGFNDACYPPHPKKADADAIAEAVATNLVAWKTSLGKRIDMHELREIDMHLFFLPFPSVDTFRKKLLAEVGAR